MAYVVEEINGSLDQATFNPMVNILNKMPDEYEPKHLSHPEMHQHLAERVKPENAALFAVRDASKFNSVVGIAGIVIDQDSIYGKTAYVTELAVSPRARGNKLGSLLIEQTIEWSQDHHADHIIFETPPEPGSKGDLLLKDFGFEPSSYGKPAMRLNSEN